MARHRSKVIVSLLAAVLGAFGAHWWYLNRRGAALLTVVGVALAIWASTFPVWWDNIPFFVLTIPAIAGYVEALVFCLKPDAWFDARYNAGSGQVTQTRWAPVIIAIVTTVVGSVIAMFVLAVIVVHFYVAMGWLDGYNL